LQNSIVSPALLGRAQSTFRHKLAKDELQFLVMYKNAKQVGDAEDVEIGNTV
jgi:hypothetical protein